jgi:hypothetical protein
MGRGDGRDDVARNLWIILPPWSVVDTAGVDKRRM